MVLLLALGIGFAGGLRSMMPLAAVRFPKHDWTSVLFGLLALGELVGDKLPNTPARTVWYAALWRVLTGGYAGGIVAMSAQSSFIAGAVAGALGAIAGTWAGYLWRTSVRERFGGPDLAYALAEDVVAIALAFGIAR